MKKLRYFASTKPTKFNLKLESTHNIPHEDNLTVDRALHNIKVRRGIGQ